jgi:NADH:ubiquinone oxidoreductase subunit 6 (subunit J)
LRVAEVLGGVSAVFLAAVLITVLAGEPPAYRFWGENMQRLVRPDFLTLGREIGNYIYGSLFPAFIVLGLVLLTLALGVSALLRRGG